MPRGDKSKYTEKQERKADQSPKVTKSGALPRRSAGATSPPRPEPLVGLIVLERIADGPNLVQPGIAEARLEAGER